MRECLPLRDAAPERCGRLVVTLALRIGSCKLTGASAPRTQGSTTVIDKVRGLRRRGLTVDRPIVCEAPSLWCGGGSHGAAFDHKVCELRRCAGGGILGVSFGATPSFNVEVSPARGGISARETRLCRDGGGSRYNKSLERSRER